MNAATDVPATHDGPVVALVGPTASGKSAAALALAARLPVEIVSVDSAQVYRGLDVGSAKPSAQERAAVPHHLLDVADPAEAYSAMRFARDARAAIADIRARGRLPLLAGGTFLYLRALEGGMDDLPGADAALRARLAEEATRLGWPALHARLATLDLPTAARLEPRDAQRIQRALEIIELSGRPMSTLIAEAQATRTARGPDLALRLVSLEPADRGWLHARIERRFAQMLDEGLLDEVRALRACGDLHPALPSMRSVGYRQAWEHLDGAFDAAELHARGVAATRQLAKRQLTWLRSLPHREVISCDAPDAARRAAEALERAFI